MLVHRTTETTSSSLTLSCDPPESLTLSGIKLANEEYSSLLTLRVKMKVHHRLHHLMHEVWKKSSNACHIYKLHFDQKVRLTRLHNEDDMVFFDNPPAAKPRQ